MTFTVRYSHASYDGLERTFTFMLGTERTDLDTRLSRTASPGSVVYDFDAGVSAGNRSLIETTVVRAKDYFRSKFGRTVERGFTVFVRDADGPYTAAANQDSIVVYTRQAGWRPGTVANTKTMVHEVFHLLQREVGWPGPTNNWLNEGSAEYVGYSAVIEWGLLSYGDLQACQITNYVDGGGPSAPALEDLSFDAGNPVSSRYHIAWLGWDRLLAGPGGLAKLPNYWTTGFQPTFGLSESSFYADFAGYRQSLRRPGGNPCASVNR